jgi:hypothetical protein
LKGDIKKIKSKMVKLDQIDRKAINYLKSAAKIFFIELIIKELHQSIMH